MAISSREVTDKTFDGLLDDQEQGEDGWYYQGDKDYEEWTGLDDTIGVEQYAGLAFVLANDSCPLSKILTLILVVSIPFCLAWSEGTR